MIKQAALLVLLSTATCFAQADVDVAPRNLTTDVDEAMLTTETLISDTRGLEREENMMYIVIREDAFLVLQGVLDKFRSFGVPQETLELLLTNMSLAHEAIQLLIYEQLLRVAELLQLFDTILADLENNWNNLGSDLEVMQVAQITFGAHFRNTSIDVDIQLNVVKNMFNDVKNTLTPEQAAEIDVDLTSAQDMIDAQYDKVTTSKNLVDLGMTLLGEQLTNITEQLPGSGVQPMQLY